MANLIQNVLERLANAFRDRRDGEVAGKMVGPIWRQMSNQALEPCGLVPGTSDPTKLKTGNEVIAFINGSPVKVAAAEVTLSGITVADTYYNVVAVDANASGVLSCTAGTPDTTFAGVVPPPFVADKARVGYWWVHASGTAFTGGTCNIGSGGTTPFTSSGASVQSYTDIVGIHDWTLKAGTTLAGV